MIREENVAVRDNPLLVDIGVAFVIVIVALIIAPGVAVVALIALLVLAICGVTLLVDRRRKVRRRTRARRPRR